MGTLKDKLIQQQNDTEEKQGKRNNKAAQRRKRLRSPTNNYKSSEAKLKRDRRRNIIEKVGKDKLGSCNCSVGDFHVLRPFKNHPHIRKIVGPFKTRQEAIEYSNANPQPFSNWKNEVENF